MNGTLFSLTVRPEEIVEEATKTFDAKAANWSPHAHYNLVFLRAQQAYMNDLLMARGHVFLNEIYDVLGLPRTQLGVIVGWSHSDPSIFNSVDFGVRENDNGSIALTFNVQGVIYNLI